MQRFDDFQLLRIGRTWEVDVAPELLRAMLSGSTEGVDSDGELVSGLH